jgi:MoxR-like ATPase
MASKIQALRSALQSSFKEREEIIDGMLVAILARENIFLLGPPGTAKSALINAVAEAFQAPYFGWLMTKTTTPEELYGPYSMKALTEGRYERVTDNKLPQAVFVFLDEVFKGSSTILNTLLMAINERKFHNGGAKAIDLPLNTVMGASNEIPSENLAAFDDRFTLRLITDRIQSDDNFIELLSSGLNLKLPQASLKDLAAEQKIVDAVQVDKKILVMLAQIRQEIHAQGITVSDRKYLKALKLIKANAHLNGHISVEPQDLQVLAHVLWQDPSQQKNVRRLVQKICNPMGEKVSKALDAILEIPALLQTGKVEGVEAQKKVKKMLEDLKKLGDPEKHPDLKHAIQEGSKINAKILKDVLGLE